MPRIYDGRSDPYDYCAKCFPKTEAAAQRIHGTGEGPDGRGNCFSYDAEHPPYDDTGYRCHKCNKRLSGKDDYLNEGG